MFTNDELKGLYTRVFDRMVGAGWIHHYTLTDGRGFHPAWTVKGAGRAAVIQKIIRAAGLDTDDRAPKAFDKLGHGEKLGILHVGELEANMAELWRDAVGELGLRGDDDGLLVFVHIISSWAPGSQTQIVFGS